jgi:replicative DNA helicase
MSDWEDLQDRVPPQDLLAEAALLSALFCQADLAPDVVANCQAAFFYSDANRKIFEVISELMAKGRPWDITSVLSELDDKGLKQRVGGAKYLAEVMDAVPAISAVDDYVRRLRDKWMLRQWINTTREGQAIAYTSPPEDAAEFISRYDAELSDIGAGQTEQGLPFAATIGATFERYAKMASGTLAGRPTGITRLDELTGGLQEQNLTIIGARPGMGKTGLSCCMGVASAMYGGTGETLPGDKKAWTLMFSLEMPTNQIDMRLACMEARIDVKKAMTGALGRSDLARLAKAVDTLTRYPLRWITDDNCDLTVADIDARTRLHKSRLEAKGERLGLVIVDYLQLVKASHNPKGYQSREQQITEVANGLKRTARKNDVPVIANVQLNRDVEKRKDRRPELADIRESGGVEQAGDEVILIYREEYYEPETEDAAGIAELTLAKQRNGPTGKCKCRYQKECVRFDNLSDNEELWNAN